ncbi:MAG: hypothetical protein Q8J76_01065 [Desulfobulbaceae bacterium]|nr:hypothetical protein [Desulfobulbaceae bacterium]
MVEKSNASYATPEEAYAAKISALLHHDLIWYYETLTPETAAEDKELFQKAGIDPKKNFDLVQENEEIFVLENRSYKSGVLLIGMSRGTDGVVMRGSTTLVQINGQWKITSEFGYDPDLDQYDSLVLPSQIITPFSVRIHPEELDLNWYNKVKGQQVEHVEVVCVLQGIKDGDGKVLPVSEISTESLYLNDLVPHSPWSSSKNKPIDILILTKPDEYMPGEFKSFNSWWKKANIPYSTENPVMLVKFNQYKVMQTLANPTPDKEYELSITGRLKDDRPFKSSARIRLSESTSPPVKK